uniref:Uncharacterized protein n=1 Tax=Manihot esculenta TaxID=3983 RepID=A0A2C9WEP4_MANES
MKSTIVSSCLLSTTPNPMCRKLILQQPSEQHHPILENPSLEHAASELKLKHVGRRWYPLITLAWLLLACFLKFTPHTCTKVDNSK